MNHCIKTKGKRMTALFLVFVLALSMFSTTAFAAQEDNYHDPADHWLSAVNRTNELDANAVVAQETFTCAICKQPTSFQVWRTPEYTRNGETAMTRNVRYSDGTLAGGEGTSAVMDGTPGKDAFYTGFHWTKSCCNTCGTMNSNMGIGDYSFGKNVYWLYDCAAEFTEELPEQVKFEYVDSTYHNKITSSGTYCCFCFGTNKNSSSKLERYNMQTEILPQISNNRFAIVKHCVDCEYTKTEYVAAKSVVADYYGVVDGQPHTLTLSDLSEAGVTTQIRYGNSAEFCTLSSAPNYTEKGQYTVYYDITYTYSGVTMTENGVAYVWLHDETAEPDGNCPYGCDDPDCDCQNKDCNGSCNKNECGDNHNFVVLETVNPTCKTLGYAGYVKYLTNYGVVYGRGDKIFAPEDEITRAEFTVMAVRFFEVYGEGAEEIVEKYEGFSDVSSGYWAAEYIKDAAIHGWVYGYGDGTFHADANITRAEVVSLMNRMLGRTPDKEYIMKNLRYLNTFSDLSSKHWAYLAVMEAANAHTAILGDAETWSK